MKYRTHFMRIFLFLLSMIFFTGCGKKTEDNEKEVISSETIDWKTKGFAVVEDEKEEQGLWIKEYIPWRQSDERLQEDGLRYPYPGEVGLFHGKIYRLVFMDKLPVCKEAGYVLKIYDVRTGEAEFQEFSSDKLLQNVNLGNEVQTRGSLVGFKVLDDNQYVIQWTEWQEVEEERFKQSGQKHIYCDGNEITRVVDVWTDYLKYQIMDDRVRDYMLTPRMSIFYDSQGNSYALGDEVHYEYTGMYVFDPEGKLLNHYQGSEYQRIQEPFHAESGDLIFPIYDAREKKYSFKWYDLKNNEWKEAASFKSALWIKKVFGMQGNEIYYEMSQGIVRWNIETGERKLVFVYQENGVATDYRTMLVFRDEEAPILRIYSDSDEEDDWLALMSYEKISGGETIRMVDLVVTSRNPLERRLATECAALLSRKDKTLFFSYEKSIGDWKDYRDKIFREFVLGTGPDMLYVSMEEFEILQKKGLLMDLREIIPEETLNDILPGVLEMGTLDGKLVGLPYEVNVEGMVVSKDTWAKDSWTMTEYLDLIRQDKLERAVNGFMPLASVCILTRYSMDNPEIIERQMGKCHFTEKAFLDLLTLLNVDRDQFEDETPTYFNDGKRVFFYGCDYAKELFEYVDLAEKNNGNFVGYPTRAKSGNYLEADGVVVVNKNTKNIEAAKKYFEYLLGDEIQDLCNQRFHTKLSVKKFDLKDIETDEEGKKTWKGVKLQVYPDGTTSLHKAKEFLESCVPVPYYDEQIPNILREELPPYFEGQKTAKQVAEIVQSRVQLYLDEGN